MTGSWKPLGTGAPVLMALTLGCWLYMLWSIAAWIGRTPAAGREEDRIMQQVFSGGLAVGVWLLVGGLLVLAGTKGDMPSSIGFASWFLHPLSCLLALAAIAVMYDAQWRWAVVVPAVAPLLIATYAIRVLWMAGRETPPMVGLAMWAAVLALGLPVILSGVRFQEKYMPRGESVKAVPGPELDRFMARERERRRQDGLETLRKVNADTVLGDLENLTRGDSLVKSEALEAMRKFPNKQRDAEKALQYEYFWILRLLPQLDVEATPNLCAAARHYLLGQVRDWRSVTRVGPSDSMGDSLEEGSPGIGWIAKNCECGKELEALDELARDQQDTPAVRSFRETLKGFREGK